MEKKTENPLTKVIASTLLGGQEFVEAITEKYLKQEQTTRDIPALRSLRRASIEEIAEEVKRVFNDEPTARKVVIHIAHTYGGNRLKEIGTYFGIGESGVSQSSKRFAAEIAEDRRLRSTIDRIRQRLGL